MLRMVISGGGTGGHIYPALAIAKEVKGAFPGAEITFAGTAQGLEATVVPKEGFEFAPVAAMGLSRSSPLRWLASAWKLTRGFFQSLALLKLKRPHVVVGTGGYVCAPVLLAAVALRIPALVHESNLYPGVTVRRLAPLMKRVLAGFDETGQRLWGRCVTVGTPI